jgi:hypothetical protein
MKISKLRASIRRLSRHNPLHAYSVEIFKDTPDEPVDKTTGFLLAHERNTKKIKGNSSVYDEVITDDWDVDDLGIKAVQALKTDLGSGFRYRFMTIYTYKLLNIAYLFSVVYKIGYILNKLFPSIVNISHSLSIVNNYHIIAIEKQNISEYLLNIQHQFNDSNISQICYREAMILSNESNNWSKLAMNFYSFLRRGVFATYPYMNNLLKDMEDITSDILTNEENIIGEIS